MGIVDRLEAAERSLIILNKTQRDTLAQMRKLMGALKKGLQARGIVNGIKPQAALVPVASSGAATDHATALESIPATDQVAHARVPIPVAEYSGGGVVANQAALYPSSAPVNGHVATLESAPEIALEAATWPFVFYKGVKPKV